MKHIKSEARMSHQSKVMEKTTSYRHQAKKSIINTANLVCRMETFFYTTSSRAPSIGFQLIKRNNRKIILK